jgi:hypothetical protein
MKLIIKSILIGLFCISCASQIMLIDKERERITRGTALINIIMNILIIVAIFYL